MTTQTLPVGAATHHTEQTLTARHQEALDVYEAWADRVRSSGGQDRVAAELQRDDAWEWVEATRTDLALYRSVHAPRAAAPGRSVQHGRAGVLGRGRQC